MHLFRSFFGCIFIWEIVGLCHAPPFTTDCPARLCPRIILRILYVHRVYVLRVYVYTVFTHYVCTYTPCVRIMYIRIHRVYVLRVHTYCLGGVLLEGLRIRLTSDYSVEAAGGWLHLIIHNGLLTFPTSRCQDKSKAGSDPLIERIKQHDTI